LGSSLGGEAKVYNLKLSLSGTNAWARVRMLMLILCLPRLYLMRWISSNSIAFSFSRECSSRIMEKLRFCGED
jgi:hypothetical protein